MRNYLIIEVPASAKWTAEHRVVVEFEGAQYQLPLVVCTDPDTIVRFRTEPVHGPSGDVIDIQPYFYVGERRGKVVCPSDVGFTYDVAGGFTLFDKQLGTSGYIHARLVPDNGGGWASTQRSADDLDQVIDKAHWLDLSREESME